MIGYQDKNGLIINKDFFFVNQKSFEYKNLNKERNRRMQIWGWHKLPDIIKHYKIGNTGVKIPLGLISWKNDLIDFRLNFPKVNIPNFIGTLYADQEEKVNELLEQRVGIMNASTGVGKGVMIPYIVSKLKKKTLIIVPGIQLLNEMRDRIQKHIGVTPKVYGGKPQSKKIIIYENIIITTLDSMSKINDIDSIGVILIDEVDKVLTTEKRLEFLNKISPEYLYGFTGTLKLNFIPDKIFPIFFGKVIPFIKKHFIPNIYRIHTHYEYSGGYTLEDMKEFAVLNNEVCSDYNRNQLIINTISESIVKTEMKKGLVLTNRIEHTEILKIGLEENGIKTLVIIGDTTEEERIKIKQEVKDSVSPIVLIGSASILSRGFDLPELQVVYLTYPAKFDSLIIQSVGRVQRECVGKTYSLVYDFCDDMCGILNNQSNARLKAMKREYGNNINIKEIFN